MQQQLRVEDFQKFQTDRGFNEPRRSKVNPGRAMLIGLVVVLFLGIGSLAAWSLWPTSTGTLTVKTDQPSVVFVDGENQGAAPIEGLELPAGEHKIKIRHAKTGKEKKYTKTIEVDEESRIHASWRKGGKKQTGTKIAKNTREKERRRNISKTDQRK